MTSSAGAMSSLDMELCQNTLAALTSSDHANKNYLFLEPVDLVAFPTYATIVNRPMDLGTVKKNLEAGLYPTRDAFFADTMLCFENALTFHKGNKETQWIIGMAKEMMKLVNKEKRNAEKKATAKKPKAKNTGLKIKLSTGKGTKAKDGAAKPKIKIKGPSSTSEAATSNSSQPTTQAKPKIKLSLSKNKTAASSAPSRGKVPPTAVEKATTTKPNKIQVRLSAPSRGKELPEGVTPKPTKKAAPKKPSKKSFEMTEERKIQCMKVLSGLKRRKSEHAKWFAHPVSDKAIVDDYRAKIPKPVDLGTMATKLEKNQYKTIADFVLDVRRIFANCLRYNTESQDEFRGIAVEMLSLAEELMAFFLAKQEQPGVAYPPLLYCWKTCINIIDSLLNVKNPTDGYQTAHYFLHPIAFYFQGNVPPDYKDKVKRPMDLGTVTSLLLEGTAQSVKAFSDNCILVVNNCLTYYEGNPAGVAFTDQALRLKKHMSQGLHALSLYDQSPAGQAAREKATNWKNVKLPRPTIPFLLGIIEDMRQLKYTDRGTRITKPAMALFEKPVNPVLYADYSQFVKNPVDVQMIEQRVKANVYETPEDFEQDFLLIFRNCEAYNLPRQSDHIVALGRYGAKMFRKVFSSRMKALENPQPKQSPPVKSEPGEERSDLKRSISPSSQEKPTKRVKIEERSMPGKAAPRISIQASASAGKGSRSKSPRVTSTTQKPKGTSGKAEVPLHVAIAQIKERYHPRRPYKQLESWEGACARFFRELMKHPWLSAARPKFIFHVPVPVLFPELKETYTAKIKRPMDLTTAEAKLLQGNIYRHAKEFIDEVALVFANAITFNRAGHELGEPLSCAYYDASIHLLRYTRWLSLEFLTPYLSDDPQIDEIVPNTVPPTSWKLSQANKKKAREEMESIVMNEPIERGIQGDRYTWMESECEKLLKALRHQSDLKHMTFFIQPNYPADYAAFISKPMDWEQVQRTLSRREYHRFGEVVEDLRLIFTNALKYNARAKGTDTVSGRAYDSAIYMSKKLEAAIDKMVVTVSDRLERERIDHANAEREIETQERQERERLRERVRVEGEAAVFGDMQPRVETVETVRIVNRRPTQRRDMLDFEFPYFEDDLPHEQAQADVQKGMFERQRRARSEMFKMARSSGCLVFQRLSDRAKAIDRLKKIRAERETEKHKPEAKSGGGEAQENENDKRKSSVLSENRAPIAIRLKQVKPKKPRKKRKTVDLDFEE